MKTIFFLNDVIKKCNNKLYKDITNDYKHIFKQLYPNVSDNSLIFIKKLYSCQKKVVLIQIENKKFYLIVLSKNCEIIYIDNIYHFIDLLKKCKINNDIIKIILLFHWADGTLNNSGKHRYLISEYYKTHLNLLKKANEEFYNKLPSLIDNILFKDINLPCKINSIIYYQNDCINIINKDNIIDKFTSNQIIDDSHLHIGPLVIQNEKRNISFNESYEGKRQNICLRWYEYHKNL